MEFTWQAGRKLAGMVKDGVLATYKYNSDGIRTEKVVNGVKTVYYIVDNAVVAESRSNGVNILYLFDESGTRIGMTYNGQNYYYLFNAQGDVTAIMNSSGTVEYRYVYDAWGKLIGIYNGSGQDVTDDAALINVGYHNPIRYRGYYYDNETGFYYCNSRYYDPEVGRWINADNQIATGDMSSMNLFAYCGNNPVNRIDPTGEAWWHWALGAAVVAACAVATVVTCGGFAAAATAVCMVSSGVAAATTASTVAAAAFVGSATVFGTAVLSAASSSDSVEEFNAQGNWEIVVTTAFGGLSNACDGYTMSKTQTPTSTPTGKGTQNPKVKAAVQKGQAMHKQMDYGPGVLKEKPIAPGCRVDGIDIDNRIIYELKPNNPQAIARGMKQLDRYTSAASEQFGGKWTGVLKLYD